MPCPIAVSLITPVASWLRDRYPVKAADWRSIDGDWLEAGGALALKVDSDTSNTNLALAFELEPGGDVLLFAADAQVGLGLELMTHPGLCAMIPVVEAEARRVKDGKAVHRGWNMPFPDLYARLLKATGGRLLRGDADPGKGARGDTICEDAAFLSRVTGARLYHELRLCG